MDNQKRNRVEIELDQWREREDRFNKLFSESLSTNKSFQREKLHYYEQVAAKFKVSPHLDDQFALLVLKQERKAMEKKLYPNLWIRLLRRLLVIPFREKITIRYNTKQVEQNSQILYKDLQDAGFSGLSAKVDLQLKSGQEQFSIPVSFYTDEKKRLDYKLSFAKDQMGQYRFEGYGMSLLNQAKPEESRQQYFSMETGSVIDITRAHNLLEGRAIMKDGTWFQLDFNDKDRQGNYLMKEFQSGFGYDLEKLLQQLPLKDLFNKIESERLLAMLRQGSRQEVTFIRDGHQQRYFIEANPQSKSINIYDEHSRKITLNKALGNQTMETLAMTNRKSLQQEQGGGKRKSNMRIS